MSKCFNPDCLNLSPENLPTNNFCIHCGKSLLLKDHFRAIRYLGEGGFGRTFVAIDHHRNDSLCVIKQFLPLQQGSNAMQKCTELFKQEADLLQILGKHPQIPDLLAFFDQDNKLYLIQEFIEGQDLLKELQQKGKFTELEVKTFLLEMLPVLDFIHQKNVIHRDIKPENIIRRNTPLEPLIYGKISDLVLIDFGVSKQVSSTIMTRLGTGVGTLGYAPPEQNRGMVNYSSDLYSLGLTAIRLLTGIIPTEINGTIVDEIFDYMQMRWIWQEYLQNLGISVNANFANVLNQMISDIPAHRYPTAKDVLNALNQTPKVANTGKITPSISQQKQGSQIITNVQQSASNAQNTGLKVPLQTARADYHKLEQFLAVQNWKNADQETANIMLKIMGREKESWLTVKDCLMFPLDELKIIDSLWTFYSEGHFGFSVQKEIWISAKIGGKVNLYDWHKYCKFADEIGWRKKGIWLELNQLSFNLQSPKGHLPWLRDQDVLKAECYLYFLV